MVTSKTPCLAHLRWAISVCDTGQWLFWSAAEDAAQWTLSWRFVSAVFIRAGNWCWTGSTITCALSRRALKRSCFRFRWRSLRPPRFVLKADVPLVSEETYYHPTAERGLRTAPTGEYVLSVLLHNKYACYQGRSMVDLPQKVFWRLAPKTHHHNALLCLLVFQQNFPPSVMGVVLMSQFLRPLWHSQHPSRITWVGNERLRRTL